VIDEQHTIRLSIDRAGDALAVFRTLTENPQDQEIQRPLHER
jgi:hypothetical protein